MHRDQRNLSQTRLRVFNLLAGLVALLGLLVNVLVQAQSQPAGEPETEAFAHALEVQPRNAAQKSAGRKSSVKTSSTSALPAVAERVREESKPFRESSATAERVKWNAPPAVAERRERALEESAVAFEAVVSSSIPPLSRPITTEWQLKNQLFSDSRELGFEDKALTKLIEELAKAEAPAEDREILNRPEAAILAKLDETAVEGLPFADVENCKLPEEDATALADRSQGIHAHVSRIDASLKRRYPNTAEKRREMTLVHAIRKNRYYMAKDALPAMQQILQVEPSRIRKQVVANFARLPDDEFTEAIANRAIFDLSPTVREAANEILKKRAPGLFRETALETLRYPWAPVAWNAAEMLIAVNDRTVVPELIELLEAPDPKRPYKDDAGRLVVDELVRIHHTNNCLLCHARTVNKDDPVAAFVPLPRSGAYYQSPASNVLVRADTTYLRQDFSAMLSSDTDTFAPRLERYDFLVRTRVVDQKKLLISESRSNYPQRRAVLFALQKLTGQNPGTKAEDWRDLLERRIASR